MNLRLLLLIATAAFTLTACPAPTPPDPSPPPAPQPGPPPPAPPSSPTPPPPAPPSPPAPPAPPSPPPPSPPPGDTTPPTIVSVTPNNGSTGVAKDAKIVIVFSEAMNEQATELAYQSTDMPAVTFTWAKGDTKLEIDPVGDLDYTPGGKLYSFKLKDTATDLAGNALAAFTSSFTTFRELTRKLTSVAALDGYVTGGGFVDTGSNLKIGDGAANEQEKSFLSFDLSGFETDGLTVPDRITSATVRVFQDTQTGQPYDDLILANKNLVAAHVDYGAILNANDFNTLILHDLGDISTNTNREYKTNSNGLESVRDDWANREARKNRSQFMLYFPLPTDSSNSSDLAIFFSGEDATNPPELTVKFLVP